MHAHALGLAPLHSFACAALQAQQWVDEVRAKAPLLRVALYHGGQRARDFPPSLLACYDVVVSTYNVLVAECPREGKGSMVGIFRVRWHRYERGFPPALNQPAMPSAPGIGGLTKGSRHSTHAGAKLRCYCTAAGVMHGLGCRLCN